MPSSRAHPACGWVSPVLRASRRSPVRSALGQTGTREQATSVLRAHRIGAVWPSHHFHAGTLCCGLHSVPTTPVLGFPGQSQFAKEKKTSTCVEHTTRGVNSFRLRRELSCGCW